MSNLNVNLLCPKEAIRILNIDNLPMGKGTGVDSSLITSMKRRKEIANCSRITYGTAQGKEAPKSRYDIYINYSEIERIAKMRGKFIRLGASRKNILYNGVLVHELSHIRYKSFDSDELTGTKLEHTVYNILEDSRIEYQLSMDFPLFAHYLSVLLYTMKERVNNMAFVGVGGIDDRSLVEPLISSVYMFCRFNVIDNLNDKFNSKVVPLIMAARRANTALECAVYSKQICLYILDYLGIQDVSRQETITRSSSSSLSDVITDDEVKEIIKNDDAKEMFNLKAEWVNQIIDEIEGANPGDEKVTISQEKEYYRTVVKKRGKEIERLRKVFESFLNTNTIAETKSGDINISRQQNAYIDSITGEDGRNYQYIKLNSRAVDLYILRDVSGSTAPIKDMFAEVMVMTVAALDNAKTVRTMVIDFNADAKVTKKFNQKASKCDISPFANGGTAIKQALDYVKSNLNSSRKSVVFLLTDGELSDPQMLVNFERNYKNVSILKIGFNNHKGNGLIPISNIEDFIVLVLNYLKGLKM